MGRLTVVGLGPGGLDRVPAGVRRLLEDPGWRVLLRTLDHPAAAELAAHRTVEAGDRFYEEAGGFDDLYPALAGWVVAAARAGDTVYAVPGSPLVGERSVVLVREAAAAAGLDVEVVAGESFLPAVAAAVGLDLLERGVQVLDARHLPEPLALHLPTVIAQVDRPMVLAGVHDALARTLQPDVAVSLVHDAGGSAAAVRTVQLGELLREEVGPRTTLFLDPPPTGFAGLVAVNRRLRAECPWDRDQTHHSLVKHLVEETYELVEAVANLPAAAPGGDADFGAYAEVEEELGDLLLQVVFHSTLAAEAGAFDVEEVAEGIRRKLVLRHPHVFGDADAATAARVISNWEASKQEEKGRVSLMDGVARSVPALGRAAKFQERARAVGFDWGDAASVVDKVVEEAGELRADLADPARAADELGDLLFSVVNLARHLMVDPELALRRSADRFVDRFRAMERLAEAEGLVLADLGLDRLDELWERAKAAEPA